LVEEDKFQKFVSKKLGTNESSYIDLRSMHFLKDSSNEVAIDLLALKLRTKLSRLSDFTALHIFVVSLRCEHSCPYCQVSRQSEDKQKFDMSEEIAQKAVELVFRSPSPTIKIEFQGGEPLLNFELIKYIVVRAKKINENERRNLDFVIATNLAVVTDEILQFCSENKVVPDAIFMDVQEAELDVLKSGESILEKVKYALTVNGTKTGSEKNPLNTYLIRGYLV
jgi:sulfatase maturation enzyme AslB (radical SAM superfamily)